MAKHLLKEQLLKVLPAKTTAAIGDGQKMYIQIRDYVREKSSQFTPHFVRLSELEINMTVLKGEITDGLTLHLYGTGGEYFTIPYSLINGSKDFFFPVDDPKFHFMVSKIGFSSLQGEIIINYNAQELEEFEKPRFFA